MWIVVSITGSALAGFIGAAAFALNPNVLYLQSTPMTEPLLFALLTVAIALAMTWCRAPLSDWRGAPLPGAPRLSRASTSVGLAFALACLTRYEAWPVTAAALVLMAWVRWRQGAPIAAAARQVARVAAYPVGAILGFMVFSRVVIGEWFVTSGFFVPDNPAAGRPFAAIGQIAWGARELSGYALVGVAMLGLASLAVVSVINRHSADRAIALSLLCTAVLPLVAFLEGHPFRIRYMVPLMIAEAVGVGAAAGLLRRMRPFAMAIVAATVVLELHPLDLSAPMVVEAQWDRPNAVARRSVTDCLRRDYQGETVMASMGSLGHYMQELSLAGFELRDFLHEGNGDIWLNALNGPRPYAGWILIEEEAEGGDMLAHIARDRPEFLGGFSRVCEAGGVALYRRDAKVTPLSVGRPF
jgi:hypothetical protein